MKIQDAPSSRGIPDSLSQPEAASPAMPPPPTLESALYGAVRFAEFSLSASGLDGARITRLICTPDFLHWTLAFGENVFSVEIVADGFSVRLSQPSRKALAA